MRRPPPIALVFLILTATSTVALQPANWSPVAQLTAGAEVRAIVDPGVTHRGSVKAADSESLTLAVDGADLRLSRSTVREVEVAGKSRKKNVWWGLAIGAAASVVAVSLQCQGEESSCNEAAPAWFYPMTGATKSWLVH